MIFTSVSGSLSSCLGSGLHDVNMLPMILPQSIRTVTVNKMINPEPNCATLVRSCPVRLIYNKEAMLIIVVEAFENKVTALLGL